MRVLLTGAEGQLGRELIGTRPKDIDLIGLARCQLDIADQDEVRKCVHDSQPEAIINAAAYTDVDGCERDPDLARAVNARGPEHLAEAASRLGSRLIQISTDFVFDGEDGRPYSPETSPSPINVYGDSKREGEKQVLRILGDRRALVLRTAWLYSSGNGNFVTTILEHLKGGRAVKVVMDQIGSPTWSRSLARAIWRGLETQAGGVQHWTDAGVASRYDFAVAIAEEALGCGLLDGHPEVVPIHSEDFPTKAKRPACVILNCVRTWKTFGLHSPHWRASLRECMNELAVDTAYPEAMKAR